MIVFVFRGEGVPKGQPGRTINAIERRGFTEEPKGETEYTVSARDTVTTFSFIHGNLNTPIRALNHPVTLVTAKQPHFT